MNQSEVELKKKMHEQEELLDEYLNEFIWCYLPLINKSA